jgi:hypothetical protein
MRHKNMRKGEEENHTGIAMVDKAGKCAFSDPALESELQSLCPEEYERFASEPCYGASATRLGKDRIYGTDIRRPEEIVRIRRGRKLLCYNAANLKELFREPPLFDAPDDEIERAAQQVVEDPATGLPFDLETKRYILQRPVSSALFAEPESPSVAEEGKAHAPRVDWSKWARYGSKALDWLTYLHHEFVEPYGADVGNEYIPSLERAQRARYLQRRGFNVSESVPWHALRYQEERPELRRAWQASRRQRQP